MNEFFLANNRSITIGEIIVHQLQMHNFDEWGPHAKVIKDYLKTQSDEIYKTLFKARTAEVITLLSKSTHQDETALISVVEASESTLFHLIEAVVIVNDAFFGEKEPKRKRGRKAKGKDAEQSSWFDNFQLLIDAGHNHEDILQMSYGTFIEYLKSAQKQQLAKMRIQTNLMRAAQHAKDKAYTKLMEELNPSDD